jgi:hypothetical protein
MVLYSKNKIIVFLLLIVSHSIAFHLEGGSCYNYFSTVALVADTGISSITPMSFKNPTAYCSTNTTFELFMEDCSTPYVDTHPNIVLTEAADFYSSGIMEVDTTTPT